MDEAGAPCHHFDDTILLTEAIAGRLDAVASEIVQCAAAGLGDVPEMCAVRAAVRFPRPHPEYPADASVFDRLARLDDAWREDFGLGVPMECARSLRGIQHATRFLAIARERFRADLMPAFRGEHERHRLVRFVGQRDDEEIDTVAGDETLHIIRRRGYRPLPGERPRAGAIARIVRNDFVAGDVRQALHVEFSDEAGAQQRDRNRRHNMLSYRSYPLKGIRLAAMANSPLTREQILQYRHQGFVLAKGFFDREEIGLLHRAAKEDRELDRHSFARADGEGGQVRLSLWNHPGDTIYGMFARCESVVKSAEAILDGEVYHYHSKMIMKDANVGGAW